MVDKLLYFEDPDFWTIIKETHFDKGGLYKIVAVRDGVRVPINRFLGTDEEGVLYIGKATSYLDRVINLKKSISPNYKGTSHICGRRYKSNPNIALKFPYDLLHIELIFSEDPEKLEKLFLNAYFKKYGEVPPLNAVG